MSNKIWIGWDSREAAAFAVCRASIERHLTQAIPVSGLLLNDLQRTGLYTRPMERRDGGLWDVMSKAPMSTEFAVSRFFLPHMQQGGWALFLDCDMLARTSFARLFEEAKDKYAVMVVKHDYQPTETVKMDGQAQTKYARKNWSSFMLWNLDHPAHKALTLEALNTLPGRDLHRFCWLKDEEIGELGPEWNYLVGVTKADIEPNCVHFTLGGPWFPGYEDVIFANEWREELRQWAR